MSTQNLIRAYFGSASEGTSVKGRIGTMEKCSRQGIKHERDSGFRPYPPNDGHFAVNERVQQWLRKNLAELLVDTYGGGQE